MTRSEWWRNAWWTACVARSAYFDGDSIVMRPVRGSYRAAIHYRRAVERCMTDIVVAAGLSRGR